MCTDTDGYHLIVVNIQERRIEAIRRIAPTKDEEKDEDEEIEFCIENLFITDDDKYVVYTDGWAAGKLYFLHRNTLENSHMYFCE